MRILLAEDDRDLSRALKTLLERSGYSVETVFNGQDALDYALSSPYDGWIMDWMMPKLDGVSALCALRSKGMQTPCLILTAREAVEDRIRGLDAGADDYLPKPFAAGELLARVRAMLRRSGSWQSDLLHFGNVTLDRGGMLLACGEQSVRLTAKAFQTMELLMSHPGMVFSAEKIMEKVWGWDTEAEINVVWVNISTLRKRLAELHADVTITAIRGSGYVLEGMKG